jgi:GNAT superfamily N-acetyltransferase
MYRPSRSYNPCDNAKSYLVKSITAHHLYKVELQRPEASELASLFDCVGWGSNPVEVIARSIAVYPCTICAKAEDGTLVGYLSAFSDEVISTMLGELVVHPAYRRRGVASAMLEVVEQRYPDAPIYIKAMGESKRFYAARGFKQPKAELTVMFKHPAVSMQVSETTTLARSRTGSARQ